MDIIGQLFLCEGAWAAVSLRSSVSQLWVWEAAHLSGAKAEGTPEKVGLCLSLPNPCSPEQSNDDLVMEVLSDIMMQLPLTVENEEVSGPESQCTFKFIMASPIWEKLNKNIQGK